MDDGIIGSCRSYFLVTFGCFALGVTACGGGPTGTTDPPPPPPPASGSILAAVVTSGPAGVTTYLVSVDQGAGISVAVNGSVTIQDLDAGAHQLQLQGLPSNCVVSGDNPKSASVTSNAVTDVQFAVTCTVPTGSIQANVETTGAGSDPDGLTVVLDGVESKQSFANAIVTFLDVAPGSHTVELQDMAANCTVQPAAQQDADVTSGETAMITFSLVCSEPPPLSNQIFYFSNPGGGTAPHLMNADGSGAHELPSPNGNRPDISPDGRFITYDSGSDILILQTDGNVVANLGRGFGPSWSPNGSQITFVNSVSGQEDILVMDADGTNVQNITNSGGAFDKMPDWGSGGRIAFGSQPSLGVAPSMLVMESDGTGLVEVIAEALEAEPQMEWSPDGLWLLYTGADEDIWVIRPDGTGLRNVTNSPSTADVNGTWSPDGTKIAFESLRDGNWDIYTINFDGSGLSRLTTDPAHDGIPAWSP